ncbi:biopolymer transporter ExbD [Luteolibacter sp. SL250]|uniref:ExbD/TolR family protein n=1 Tax=Luteolibacter sp. SL250 TaxID=2995170 RepID=UPI00226FBC72|nr:biopolymer transporter ExbD [Luteolibacter sp. SL250]WAC19823.1 biopolymer transporter ExbD [Luteolibacter sp. SL250]
MKLEMTLPERPGFLHAVPVLNLFALLLLFLLLGPSFVMHSGISVEMPPSRFQMERFRDSLVVTLGPGRLHLGRDSMTLPELLERLDEIHGQDGIAKTIVLMQTDAGTPVGVEREVTEAILAKGFRIAYVGQAIPSAVQPIDTPAE